MKILPIHGVNPLLYQRTKHWNVLSVCREYRIPLTFLCRRHRQIDCDDLLIKDVEDPANAPLIAAGVYVPPERVHVELGLDFARKVGTEHLIVHCAQGLSRSPAMAWCILLDQLGSHTAATEALFKLRPQAIPNDLIIRHGVQILTGNLKLFPEVLRDLRARQTGLDDLD